ncbi:MAG: hypothetical protein ACRDU5_04810 [Mycobacterium sp.]
MSGDEPLARRTDSSECRECRAGLAHCHGTLIHHALRRSECTEGDCTTPDVVHAYGIDCEAVGCSCGAAVALAM